MRIDIKCAKCGSNRFAIDGTVADETVIRCEDCAHEIGTFGELKERVANEVLSHARRRRSAGR